MTCPRSFNRDHWGQYWTLYPLPHRVIPNLGSVSWEGLFCFGSLGSLTWAHLPHPCWEASLVTAQVECCLLEASSDSSQADLVLLLPLLVFPGPKLPSISILSTRYSSKRAQVCLAARPSTSRGQGPGVVHSVPFSCPLPGD